MDGDDPEHALVRALRDMAGLSPTSQDSRFDIRRGGVVVHVFYSSGSGSYIELHCPYDEVSAAPIEDPAADHRGGYRSSGKPDALRAIRPLEITLRRETEVDKSAKEAGYNREYQTGDAMFDAEVYVDTQAEGRVLAAILSPPVRDAVRALFSFGFSSVVIDNPQGDVSAKLFSFSKEPVAEGRAEAIVSAFATILESAPRIERAAGERPRDPARDLVTTGGVFAAILGLAVLGSTRALLPSACIDANGFEWSVRCEQGGCCDFLFLGAPGGAVLGALFAAMARALVWKRLSGRSDSAAWIRASLIIAFVLGLELSIGLVLVIGPTLER